MLIFDSLRSTGLASVVFGLIPVGWWRIKGRKQAGFAAYFGLIRPQKNKSAGRMIVVYWLVWGVTHLDRFRGTPGQRISVLPHPGFIKLMRQPFLHDRLV